MEQVLYALAWAAFGAVHSALAAAPVKARLVPLLGPWYRIAFNAVAVLSLAAVWGIGRTLLGTAPPFPIPTAVAWTLLDVEAAGWIVLAVALTRYDLGRFLGTRQIAENRRGLSYSDDEPLRTDGPHRFVRHPLYAGAFLVLWGRVDGVFALATAAWGSLYLLIGAAFEERRLLRLHGSAYAEYRRRVPAFVPWRGRAI